ncbi:MAG: hypothetical protein WD059_14045 [Balneolaceae bacterium]
MKNLSLLIIQFLFITSIYGQGNEYSVHLNSGLFSFGGESATQNTMINVGANHAYTNNPFGSKKALSYGLAGQYQRVTESNILLGIQSGYEKLRSRVTIDRVFVTYDGSSSANGRTYFEHNFINLYPFVGYRFTVQNLNVDLALGPEFGFHLSSREKGEATTDDGSTFKTDYERNDPGRDFRIRPSLTFHYKNWGVSTGYSFGLHNYLEGSIGGVNKAYAQLIRFGITYKLQ